MLHSQKKSQRINNCTNGNKLQSSFISSDIRVNANITRDIYRKTIKWNVNKSH